MEKSAIEKEILTKYNNLIIVDSKNFFGELGETSQAHCYFIVQNTNQKEEINSLARILLDKGCRDFHFCGSHEPLWHMEFDLVYVDSFQNKDEAEDEDRVALTSGYDNVEELADELLGNLSYWCTDEAHYLIYDDQEDYKKLLQYWKGEGWK